MLGQNIIFERRGAMGQMERLPALAQELIEAKVDVLSSMAIGPRSTEGERQPDGRRRRQPETPFRPASSKAT